MLAAVEKITTGPWKTHCYLALDEEQNCVVIDPGGEPQLLCQAIRALQAKPLAILNTHGHFDHIGAVAAVKEQFGIRFYMHSADLKLLQNANLYQKIFAGQSQVVIPEVDLFLDKISWPLVFGGLSCSYIATPGHTKGSVCFAIDQALFTGDTLFRGKIGRTDLPGASKSSLRDSLVGLANLDPSIKIYPGHGSDSTLAVEYASNQEFIEILECA